MAQLVLDWMKAQPIPRSLAATTATAPHRLLGWPGVRHSPLDPEGFEWEEYQEIGRVLDRRPPAGLAEAWQRNYNSGFAWSMVTTGYWDVPEDSQWGRAEEAAWPGQLIETTTTNWTNTSTTNMRGEPTNRSTIANMRGKWRHKPRWPQQLAPP